MIGVDEVVRQLLDLGVRSGSVMVVHTSFRAMGPIAGGPLGLIQALTIALGPEGTLVMPTMTDGQSVFDPTATPTVDMGITAETFWRQPGVLRSTHPGGSFAARGPAASAICREQPLSPPHGPDSPVGRVHELDGDILLLGVSHSENTTLHLAEAIAQVPYAVSHPCVVEIDGCATTMMIAETDHCCAGFALMDDWLRAETTQREGKVGKGGARHCRSRDVVTTAVQHLAADPLIFLCPGGNGCLECDAARASIAN